MAKAYTLTIPILLHVEEIQKEVEKDEELQQIVKLLQVDLDGKPKFQLILGQLQYKGR